jgi:single-strand DNA-binding protein
MNVVIVSGRAGKDPEATKGNAQGAHFSLAISERYKDKAGAWQDRTTWVNVQVWGKFSAFALKHIRKGDKVLVQGKISVSEYNQKTYTSIVAEKIEPEHFRKDEDQGPQGDEPSGADGGGAGTDEDLPF